MQHYFIGLKLPEDLAQQLVDTRQEWHLEKSHKRLPVAEDLHITLLYLGAVETHLLKQLLSHLDSLSQNFPPIDITLNGLSIFGNPLTPRVVYTAIEEQLTLQLLQKAVLEKCLELFLQVDKKPFVPHITLAKKWSGQHEISLKDMYFEKQSFSINAFSVFAINPKEVPSYQEIHTIYLKGLTS